MKASEESALTLTSRDQKKNTNINCATIQCYILSAKNES